MSGRYGLPLAVLLMLTLWPTLRAGYFSRAPTAPSVRADLLPLEPSVGTGSIDERAAAAVRYTFPRESWAERAYTSSAGGTIRIVLVRGYDMKKLYHHPELGLLRGRSFQPLRTEHLPLSGDQVRVLQNSTDGESAVYGFVYEGQWVDNPYLLHVRSAFTSLWNGPQPLTLVFAYGDVLRDGELDPRVVELLQRTSARLASSLLPPDR